MKKYLIALCALTALTLSTMAFSADESQEIIMCVHYDNLKDIVDAESYVIIESEDGTKDDLEILDNTGCAIHKNTHGWWDSFTLKYVINGVKESSIHRKLKFSAGVKHESDTLYKLLYITKAEIKFDVDNELLWDYRYIRSGAPKELEAVFKVESH